MTTSEAMQLADKFRARADAARTTGNIDVEIAWRLAVADLLSAETASICAAHARSFKRRKRQPRTRAH